MSRDTLRLKALKLWHFLPHELLHAPFYSHLNLLLEALFGSLLPLVTVDRLHYIPNLVLLSLLCFRQKVHLHNISFCTVAPS